MLAEELGTSVITNITEIALDGDKVTAKQETEEGYRTVEASAPCVVTVTKPEYDPRYPTIKNKMAARKKPIRNQDSGRNTRRFSNKSSRYDGRCQSILGRENKGHGRM